MITLVSFKIKLGKEVQCNFKDVEMYLLRDREQVTSVQNCYDLHKKQYPIKLLTRQDYSLQIFMYSSLYFNIQIQINKCNNRFVQYLLEDLWKSFHYRGPNYYHCSEIVQLTIYLLVMLWKIFLERKLFWCLQCKYTCAMVACSNQECYYKKNCSKGELLRGLLLNLQLQW